MAEAIGIQRRIHGNLGEPRPELERRGKIGEVLDFISKFAFESTVIQSLGISTGRKQEESKDADKKLAKEEIQAKIEKLREEMERTKLHQKTAKCMKKPDESFLGKIEKLERDMSNVAVQCKASGLAAEKSDGGDSKGLESLGKSGKKVFIRSRL